MEGNKKTMRETLELVNKIYDLLSKPCIVIEEVRQVCQKARAVLIATPLRNCDVGTVEEQSKRFCDFCKIESSASGGHCTGCRAICYGKNKCELAWAQMPYEAEE